MKDPNDGPRLIHRMREHRVMLSQDLAKLYEVPPKALVQAVKRNLEVTDCDFKLSGATAL